MALAASVSPTRASGEGKKYPPQLPEQLDILSQPSSMPPSSIQSPSGTYLSMTSANTSLQSSPEGPRGRHWPGSHPPTPLQLPEPVMSTPVLSSLSPSATWDGSAPKGPGLMRRISPRRQEIKSKTPTLEPDRDTGPQLRPGRDAKTERE